MSPLLSVIIPMYGVEKFIKKCLESIIDQTYKNVEIICVDDATRDKSAAIAEEYASRDSRIKVLHNTENLGLFRARVEGLKAATGDYIAFVDADDFVSLDWFRLLIEKIREENADIVIGNDISVNQRDERYYHNNYRYLTHAQKTVEGEAVLDTYYRNVGGCYAWHVVWNKVYSRALVERCLPYFNRVDFHLIMLEDIAFSSVFYTHAKKLCFADVDCYFYYRHDGASTSTTLPAKKICKNVKDAGNALAFLKDSLISYDKELYGKYEKKINELVERYRRIWCGVAAAPAYAKNADVKRALAQAFGSDETVLPKKDDFYFYDVSTGWDNRQESIKQLILFGDKKKNKNAEVISFDIFDTLIKRMVYDPQDIMCFVGRLANAFFPFITESNFGKMRADAESHARSLSKKEDITLTEIYDAFAELYSLPRESVNKIYELECETEIKYCRPRSFVKEIFDIAILSGKRVVITSDMYLELDIIEKMLHKCGYSGYERLFLSSDVGLLKSTGSLYKHVAKELGVSPDKILHIGDTFDTDIVSAKKQGLQAVFIPKSREVFENRFEDYYAGSGYLPFKNNISPMMNTSVAKNQLPIRSALAVVANNYFDNPHASFQRISNYNGDPHYMGYFPLGMYLLGMAEWIYRTALAEGYKKIVFLARDGKMLKEAFDMLCRFRKTDIKSDYFYATRKALMPYGIKCAEDFYNINRYVGVYYLKPRRILEMFADILKPLDRDAEHSYEARGIDLDEKLKSPKDFYSFVNALIDISYSEEIRAAAYRTASDAFSRIFDEHTATFDMGYSGRLQSIICELAGHPVDTFFDYSNGYNTSADVDGRFKVHTFNDYTPTMASITREFFMSDPSPSCCGYKIEDGCVTPLFDEKDNKNFPESAVASINEMQRSALEFCYDYWNIYAELGSDFVARNAEYSIAFNHFLLSTTVFDRATFRFAMEDDEVYSGYDAESIADIWGNYAWTTQNEIGGKGGASNAIDNLVNISGVGKIRRGIIYLIVDRKTLKEKFKEKFKNHKILLFVAGTLYSIPRGIVRLFRRKNK